MTIQRAIEVLSEYEIVEVGRGVFTLTYTPSGEIYVVGEQRIIDLGREMEDEE
jgi:hypothetical protein